MIAQDLSSVGWDNWDVFNTNSMRSNFGRTFGAKREIVLFVPYTFYSPHDDIDAQICLANDSLESHKSKLQQVVEEIGIDLRDIKLQQPVGEMDFPGLPAFVQWRHHIEIISKYNSALEALFYIGHDIEEVWSRSALQSSPRVWG